MLGFGKKIYNLVPSRLAYIVMLMFRIGPTYSKRHWKSIYRYQTTLKYSDNSLRERLKELSEWMRLSPFYSNENQYTSFLKNPTYHNLQRLPLLSSDLVRCNIRNIANYKVPGFSTSTGGTGGAPLELYLSDKSYMLDRLYVFAEWASLGYERGAKKLTLRGVDIGDKLTEFNPMNNELIVNTFLMSATNIGYISAEIRRFAPTFGHGYLSAWYRFAKLLQNDDSDETRPKFSGIFLASEQVIGDKRSFVREFFQCPVRATYSSSENVCLAVEVEDDVYKVVQEYGLVEIIKDDGTQADVGESGEIVCTGFINNAMPLVRYRLGDHAVVLEKNEGIVTGLCKIKGRWGKDFILDKHSNKIFTTAINIHSSLQCEFEAIQLVQNVIGELTINVVPFHNKSEKAVRSVGREFRRKLPNINVKVCAVGFGDIIKSKRGKYPYLIQKIDA